MKIAKTKEIEKVTEDITVKSGTYYFDDYKYSYKVSFTEDEDGWADFNIEKIQHFANHKSIQQFIDYGESLPWFAEQLFLDKEVKRIGEKEYKEQREKLIKEII